MKQIFHPYEKWEGYLNGMYDECKENRSERIEDAKWLLTHLEELYENMSLVTKEWTHETEVILSDSSINHRAWLGQAACNFWGNVKEDETREAWGHLTNKERKAANKVADRVDREWRNANDDETGYQLSFSDLVEGWK